MRKWSLSLGLVLATSAAAQSPDFASGDTTFVRNGSNVAIVTQGGGLGVPTVRIDIQPDSTSIYRQSGGNSFLLNQVTAPPGLTDEELLRKAFGTDLPAWFIDALKR